MGFQSVVNFSLNGALNQQYQPLASRERYLKAILAFLRMNLKFPIDCFNKIIPKACL